jgi:type I restriction enzyme S subunit
MAGEWREVRLGELVDERVLAISDGYRVRNEELGPEGIPFVRGGDIGDGWINTSTVDHIRPELAHRVRAKLAGPGDVAFITKGTVGRAGRLRTGQPQVVFAPQVAYWRVVNRDALDPVFAFYLIRSHAFQAALDGVKTHGAMVADYVSISQQQDFRLRIPSIDSQRAIAHILGTLDDKNELDRRMNETLEAMARALFKSWFVAFDPVRAKVEGRDPGLPKPIADLFPDRFEDSGLGDIPAGWKVGTLADFAELNPEVWAKDAAPDEIEYVDLANTKWGKIEATQRYLWKDAPSRAQRVLRPGDTIVGTVRPGNGSFYLVAAEGLTGSTGFAVLRPRKAIYEQYIYLAATSSDNIDRLSHLADGAAYPAVRPHVALATQTVLPGDSMIECFARAGKPLMERMAENERESLTLAALRDTLLPKLISGELRVRDAERFLGRVG